MNILKLKFLSIPVLLILSILLIALVVKGNKGNPIYYQTEMDTNVGGPYEASNSNARYALIEAIVNDHTFFLSTELAKIASPDIVQFNNKFISIFTPGVSFVGLPFYIAGKALSLPQLFTYFSVSLFALINLFLVARVARKLGAGFYSSLLSGFIFLFATNALVYSQSLSQHHLSVTFILLALLNAMSERRTFVNNTLFSAYVGISALMDIPNPIIMLPLILFIFLKNFSVRKEASKTIFSIKLGIIGLVLGLIPFLAIFGYYNHATTGSYFTLAQNIGRSSAFEKNLPVHLSSDVPDSDSKASFPALFSLPFKTRNELNGLYTLLISDERSWIYYSPVILLGIGGIFLIYKKKETKDFAILIIAMIALDITLYSMFGDPWGGWAFGPRYLIPAASLLSIGLGVFIERFKKNSIFIFTFLLVLTFSIGINAVGALTTSAIPPKVEAVNLPQPIPYTFKYNFEILDKGTSSLTYNIGLNKYLTTSGYFEVLVVLITAVGIGLLILSIYEK